MESATGNGARNERRLSGVVRAGQPDALKRRSRRLVSTSWAGRVILLRRQPLADDEKLRGGRGGDHRRFLGFKPWHSNRAHEPGELDLRKARRTHLAQETRP